MQFLLPILTRINFLWPLYIGFKYLKFKRDILNRDYKEFDNLPRLIDIVNDSISKVPYYNKRYTGPIETLDDFQNKIDFIDKDDVMNDFYCFQNPYEKGLVSMGTTGGTSGMLPESKYAVISEIKDVSISENSDA